MGWSLTGMLCRKQGMNCSRLRWRERCWKYSVIPLSVFSRNKLQYQYCLTGPLTVFFRNNSSIQYCPEPDFKKEQIMLENKLQYFFQDLKINSSIFQYSET